MYNGRKVYCPLSLKVVKYFKVVKMGSNLGFAFRLTLRERSSASGKTHNNLLFRFQYLEFYPAVCAATFLGVVGGDRFFVGVALVR